MKLSNGIPHEIYKGCAHRHEVLTLSIPLILKLLQFPSQFCVYHLSSSFPSLAGRGKKDHAKHDIAEYQYKAASPTVLELYTSCSSYRCLVIFV